MHVWEHVEAGFYRRRDGKGVINRVGPNDWAAMADMGAGLVPVGNGHTAQVAASFVDQACDKKNC